MKKSTSLKKLSFNKLTISKLNNTDAVYGGSGICGPGNESRPFNNCPEVKTCLRTECRSCLTNQANGC